MLRSAETTEHAVRSYSGFDWDNWTEKLVLSDEILTFQPNLLLGIYQTSNEQLPQIEFGNIQFPPEWTSDRRFHFHTLCQIACWCMDSTTRENLVPAPPEIDMHNPASVSPAVKELALYYLNNLEEQPTWTHPETDKEMPKITPLIATVSDNPVGALTIRWHGDPYVGVDKKVAGIERLVVNPHYRRQGVATKLLQEAHRLIFEEFNFHEVTLWIMLVGQFQHKIDLFTRKFNYELREPEASWIPYARKRKLNVGEGESAAYRYCLKNEAYFQRFD